MAPALPPGFEDLYTASNRTDGEVNIMGRVTHHLVPSPSRGRDLMSTFAIADATHGGDYGEGLKVRFFQPSESEHPQVRGTGDVVLLRRLKITVFKGVVMGLSCFATSWVVFSAAEIPEKAPPNRLMIKSMKLARTAEPTHSEMMYAIELCNLRDRKMDTSSGVPVSSNGTLSTLTAPSATSSEVPTSSAKSGGRLSYGGRDKFSLVKDLRLNSFYDVVGQVVKTYSNYGRLEMYVTDYTSNNMLYRYEWDRDDKENHDDYNGYYSSISRSKKWPGPYGQMTLMVALWPPHSEFAQRNINQWDFVLLQNVHVKQDRDCKMEGALHEDRFYPTKIQISVLKDNGDERVKDVLRRKREYTEKFKTQSEAFVKQARWQKEHEDQAKKPLSRQAARSKRKREKQAAAAVQESEQAPSKKQKKKNKKPLEEASPPSSPLPLDNAPHLKHVLKSTRTDLNKNVHSSHHTIPTTRLSTILSRDPTHQSTTPSGITHTLPFQNLKTRATVRVVDFFPPNIADFAIRSRKASEFDVLSDYEGSDSDSDSDSDAEGRDPRPPDSDYEEAASRKERGSKGEDKEGKERAEEEEQKWEWRFALVLEDADSPTLAKREERARMTVYVAEQDGDFLLKEDACE